MLSEKVSIEIKKIRYLRNLQRTDLFTHCYYIHYIYIYIYIYIYKGKKHFLKGFDAMFSSVISHILVILQYSLKSKTLTEGR